MAKEIVPASEEGEPEAAAHKIIEIVTYVCPVSPAGEKDHV